MHSSDALILPLLVATLIPRAVDSVNHWSLQQQDERRITYKIDSPFYMREPANLAVFLQQIEIAEFVENEYVRMLQQREQIVDHLRFSVKFSEDLVEQAKCAIEYFIMEKRTSYLKMSPTYLRRLQLPDSMTLAKSSAEPDCNTHAKLIEPGAPYTYDHLDSLRPGVVFPKHVEREEDMDIRGVDAANNLDYLRRLAVQELQEQPHSWRSHTLASYYWRMCGQAREAFMCARLGVSLAPQDSRDIALLSLGVVLLRAGTLSDAVVVLGAAVEHAADVPENHLALASALAMHHDFKRAIYHFDEAERLDPSLLQRTQIVRSFIACLENLTKRTAKMYSYVEYMMEEVEHFKKLKQEISRHHEKLMQQQVPLNTRELGPLVSRVDLLNRGQYCSTRNLGTRDEPVLFCDYYSDMQMRLEGKDVDIESLERDLKQTTEAFMRQFSTYIKKQLNFNGQTVPFAASTGSEPVASSKDK